MDKQYCIICGKELNNRQIKRGNQVCSRSCAGRKRYLSEDERKRTSDKVKVACQREDVRQRKRLAAQEKSKDAAYRQKLSLAILASWQDKTTIAHHKSSRATKEYKERQSNSQKKRYIETDSRKKLSKIISDLWKDEEYSKKTKAGMHKKWTDVEFKEYHSKRTSEGTRAAFDLRGDEIIANGHKTKLANGTFSTSEEEELSYQLLIKVFKEVRRQEPYSFNKRHACDFYIKDIDTWIECNYYLSHNPAFGPFDETNLEHLKELDRLKKTQKSNWRSAKKLSVWAKSDIQRRQEALAHGLNFIELFYLDELKSWLKKFLI